MKTSFLITVLFASLCISFANSSITQKAVFSGKWTINKTKVEFGNAPEWTAPKAFQVEWSENKGSLQKNSYYTLNKALTLF